MSGLSYRHVDVFAARAFAGNGLPVFIDPSINGAKALLAVTQELRHFETIFLWSTDDPQRWTARVFDLFEELPFAGHPLLGAAAVLHERSKTGGQLVWQIELPGRSVSVSTAPAGAGRWTASLAQGDAALGDAWAASDPVAAQVAAAFSLDVGMLHSDLPLQVMSTGLRYLIVPVQARGLARAKIKHDLTDFLARLGAQFAVLLDPNRPEARHWNNDGAMEDIATGSAAGSIAAYLRRYEYIAPGTPLTLHQGQFTGRPSELIIEASGSGDRIVNVIVGGIVAMVGSGILDSHP